MTHYQNPYLPHSLRTDDAPPVAPKQPEPMKIGGLPVGTTVQIVDWVGDDADRARLALDREKEQDRPRVRLVTELTTVIRRAERAAVEAPPEGAVLVQP